MNYKSLASVIKDVYKGVREAKEYKSVESAIKDVLSAKEANIESHFADQIVAGTYKTKHFEVCPRAQKYFSSLPKDVSSNYVEKSAILHDQLFGLEKQVLAAKKATKQDVEEAELIKKKIESLNKFLKVEPVYLEDHIKKIKEHEGKETPNPFVKVPQGGHMEVGNDRDIDNTAFPISRKAKMERKLKIIDND